MKLVRLIVWRHIRGEPLRTLLTAVGVGLGVAVYVAVATANVEVLRSFEETVVGVAGRTTLQVRSSASLPDGFDENMIRQVQQTDGVIVATPVLETTAVLNSGSPSAVALTILGVDLLAESTVRGYTIISSRRSADPSGKYPERETAEDVEAWERYFEPDAVFIGRAAARRYGLAIGSAVELRTGPVLRRVMVRGILEGQGAGRSAIEELAVMDIASAQYTFERLGRLDRIDIISDPARPVDDVAARLRAHLPPGLLVQRPDQRNAQIERMTRAFRLNVASLGAVALLAGLFLVYNTISFAVLRRRREIGILRSLGMLPSGISRLFLLEGIFLGLLGWVIGLVTGMILARSAVGAMAGTARNLSDLTVHQRSLSLSGAVIAQSLLIGIGVAVLGSLGPIREAGRVLPVHALAPKGYEAVHRVAIVPALYKFIAVLAMAALAAMAGPVHGIPLFGYLSAFLLLMAFALLGPVMISVVGSCVRARAARWLGYLPRIAAGELTRAPVRNAVAISALMVGVALMIGMGVLIHSFRLTVDTWLDQTVKADLIVAEPTWLGSGPPSVLPESVRTRLLDIPGVVAADAYRDIRVQFRDRPVAVVARDLLLHAQHSRYLFVKGDSDAILNDAVRHHRVVISEVLANEYKLRPGDVLTLPSPQGPHPFTIAGVFYDYATDGGKIVMDRGLYRQIWNDPKVSVVPLYLGAGTDPEIVRREVLKRLAGSPPVMVVTNRELKREVLRIFDETFAVTYALEMIALVVALLGIVNALLSGILERQSELAVLRAIGTTPSQIQRMVLWEAGLIGIAGAALGATAGLLLSGLLIEVINKQSFGWSIVFHPSAAGLLQAVIVSLVTTLLAGYVAARRAAAVPLAESLRYE